jgi:hypothetical protein
MQTGIYKHYKGKLYEVLGIARHSETLETLVVYKALYDSPGFGTDALWARPQQMFDEMVEMNGKWVKRFELCEK